VEYLDLPMWFDRGLFFRTPMDQSRLLLDSE